MYLECVLVLALLPFRRQYSVVIHFLSHVIVCLSSTEVSYVECCHQMMSSGDVSMVNIHFALFRSEHYCLMLDLDQSVSIRLFLVI